MPNTNCCAPLCHATSKRHKQLSWHTLPIDPKWNKRLTVAISNDTLKVNSRGTSECGLHFQGERRTHGVNKATIFPYSFQETCFSIILRAAYECMLYIFAIARRRLLELTSYSLQSHEKATGAPHAVTSCREHRSIFAGSPCVGLQQLLELLLRNWLWYGKVIWLRWHIGYVICESRFIMLCNKVSGTELSESQRVVRYQCY